MAHRSRAASLRRTSQSAVASWAPSVPSASSCRTVVRSRVTFSISRCRSTRTLSLKGHHGESKIQRTCRRSRPSARKRKTYRTRPWLRICSALKHRHPPTGLSRRLSRSIRRASRTLPSGCARQGDMRGRVIYVQGRSAHGRISRDVCQNRPDDVSRASAFADGTHQDRGTRGRLLAAFNSPAFNSKTICIWRHVLGADRSFPARGSWFWPCVGSRRPDFRRCFWRCLCNGDYRRDATSSCRRRGREAELIPCPVRCITGKLGAKESPGVSPGALYERASSDQDAPGLTWTSLRALAGRRP